MEGVRLNPLNHILNARSLTEEGLAYRRKLVYATVVYLLPPIVSWLLSVVLFQLNQFG
jgi:hypothetical protein